MMLAQRAGLARARIVAAVLALGAAAASPAFGSQVPLEAAQAEYPWTIGPMTYDKAAWAALPLEVIDEMRQVRYEQITVVGRRCKNGQPTIFAHHVRARPRVDAAGDVLGLLRSAIRNVDVEKAAKVLEYNVDLFYSPGGETVTTLRRFAPIPDSVTWAGLSSTNTLEALTSAFPEITLPCPATEASYEQGKAIRGILSALFPNFEEPYPAFIVYGNDKEEATRVSRSTLEQLLAVRPVDDVATLRQYRSGSPLDSRTYRWQVGIETLGITVQVHSTHWTLHLLRER